MNLSVYEACFREIEKQASLTSTIAQRAAGIGDSTLRFGADVGKTVAHTFNPGSCKSGWRAMRGKGNLETGLFVGPTALGAGAMAASSKDPISGRPVGPAERAALVASGVGSGLAGYHVSGGNWLRGGAVGVGAGLITDRVARAVGGRLDHTLGTAPSQPQPRVA